MMTWDSEEGESDDGEQGGVPPQVVAEPGHQGDHGDDYHYDDDGDNDGGDDDSNKNE